MCFDSLISNRFSVQFSIALVLVVVVLIVVVVVPVAVVVSSSSSSTSSKSSIFSEQTKKRNKRYPQSGALTPNARGQRTKRHPRTRRKKARAKNP